MKAKKTCKTCKFRKDCGGFRDRMGRCPEGMAGHPGRFPKLENEQRREDEAYVSD